MIVNKMCKCVVVLTIILIKILSIHTLNYDTKNDYSVCKNRTCLRKCCPENFVLTKESGCTQLENVKLELTVFDGLKKLNDSVHFHVIHSKSCTHGTNLRLSAQKFSMDTYYLQRNGSLFRPFYNENTMISFDMFCMETFVSKNGVQVDPLVCFLENILPTENTGSAWSMIISMPFLLLTFLAYALLPDRNLHMKALMIYVINLLMGYLFLVIIQLTNTKFGDTTCSLIGIFCLFFFMVSFFWMNIICIDIWLTFSGLRGFSGSKKSAEQKRFFMYCGYGLGIPFLHVLIVYLIDAYTSISPKFKPGIGYGKCFLQDGYPELLYFYGPIALLITANIVLFIVTAFKIRSIKKDTSMLKKGDSKRHSYENDKQIFNLYVKLLFAMGINWSMEIISWLVLWQVTDAPEYLWYITDFCNALYGVFIFFIFVYKRSTWKLLKKRYYSFIGKPHLAHSLTVTNTTRVTSYSTVNSSVHGDPRTGVNDTSTLTSEA